MSEEKNITQEISIQEIIILLSAISQALETLVITATQNNTLTHFNCVYELNNLKNKLIQFQQSKESAES